MKRNAYTSDDDELCWQFRSMNQCYVIIIQSPHNTSLHLPPHNNRIEAMENISMEFFIYLHLNTLLLPLHFTLHVRFLLQHKICHICYSDEFISRIKFLCKKVNWILFFSLAHTALHFSLPISFLFFHFFPITSLYYKSMPFCWDGVQLTCTCTYSASTRNISAVQKASCCEVSQFHTGWS